MWPLVYKISVLIILQLGDFKICLQNQVQMCAVRHMYACYKYVYYVYVLSVKSVP